MLNTLHTPLPLYMRRTISAQKIAGRMCTALPWNRSRRDDTLKYPESGSRRPLTKYLDPSDTTVASYSLNTEYQHLYRSTTCLWQKCNTTNVIIYLEELRYPSRYCEHKANGPRIPTVNSETILQDPYSGSFIRVGHAYPVSTHLAVHRPP